MRTIDLVVVLVFVLILVVVTMPLVAYWLGGSAAVTAIIDGAVRLLTAFASVVDSVGKAIRRSYGPLSGQNQRETDARREMPAELDGGPGEAAGALPEWPRSSRATSSEPEPGEGSSRPRAS